MSKEKQKKPTSAKQHLNKSPPTRKPLDMEKKTKWINKPHKSRWCTTKQNRSGCKIILWSIQKRPSRNWWDQENLAGKQDPTSLLAVQRYNCQYKAQDQRKCSRHHNPSMSLLEIQDKTSKIERVNHPFPHAARISNWLFLHELFQPRLKPSKQRKSKEHTKWFLRTPLYAKYYNHTVHNDITFSSSLFSPLKMGFPYKLKPISPKIKLNE
jgi:hypothetical protein